ncbi:minor capsid protein [Fusobacterium polymorphum]|uniref:minor capsid protein n=1 Tax=Fusobacterium nucleatum subsp. polymorphum TaxID=76857 RepID=UPI0021C2FD15|nr:minor capsid protein [Fusobacterium polymorphum]
MAQKNRDYWEERQVKREAKAFTNIQDIEKEYKIALEKAKQDINKEISRITTTYMNDNILNYNEALKLLKGDDYKVWKKDLHDYIKEYKNLLKTAPLDAQKLYLEIETLSAKSRISRLDSLKAQIDMEFTKLIFGVEETGKNALNSVYRDTFIEVTKDLGINAIVSRDKIKTVLDKPWSGANFSQRIWSNTDKLAQTVKQEIVNGMIQGINLKTMTKRVSERFETAKKNDVERLLRTEVNYVLNQATLDGYKEAGIEKYEFSATLDSRTSQICSELHGEVFEIKKIAVGLNYPPMHPRCRSTTIPIIDYESLIKQGREEIGEKDTENNDKEELTNTENRSINEFKEASSIKEANEFAEKLGLRADYTGIDIRCANEWNKGLYDMKEKFPEVVENIKFIGSTQIRNKLILQEIENDLRKAGFSKEAITDSLEYAKREYKIIINKNAMAVSLFIDKDNKDPVNMIKAKYQGITMNSLHFKNYEEVTESLKMQVNGKWHPVGCNTVKAVFDHEFGHQLDSFLGIRNKKEMIEILEENKKEKGKFLSEYSIFNKLDEINIKETIAEGWSEYCNNSNPRELSQRVGKLIEREYNIYKKGSE